MTPRYFIILIVITCITAAVAFWPLPKDKSGWRRKLLIGAALSLVPVIAKMTFAVFPLLEACIMPVEIYTVIQREYWLPFAVLFFAFAGHLVPLRSRKGVRAIVILLALVTVQQSFWRLQKQEIYHYRGKIIKGVCQQTSYDTCGPASMVTLLNKIGIQTSEGEMARLAAAAPGKGISPHQAAYALSMRLTQARRPETAALVVPELKDLHDLPKPFLAGIKFSFRTNHMVCVLDTTRDSLIVGDPISVGSQKWSWDDFEKLWSGIAIILNSNNSI